MPAYNFQKQFAPLVESGQKLCTIRQTDKGAKVGDTAYLYYAQRTKQCRKLGEGTITSVVPITLWIDQLINPRVKGTLPSGHIIDISADDVAKQDGFQTVEEMFSFFAKKYGLPFNGFLHTWIPKKP